MCRDECGGCAKLRSEFDRADSYRQRTLDGGRLGIRLCSTGSDSLLSLLLLLLLKLLLLRALRTRRLLRSLDSIENMGIRLNMQLMIRGIAVESALVLGLGC